MKLGYKGLDLEFVKDEGCIAIDVLTKLFGDEFSTKSQETPATQITEENKNYPFSEEEFLKYQEQQKIVIQEKERTIKDLNNKLQQALNNYKTSKDINQKYLDELELLKSNKANDISANQDIMDKLRSEAITLRNENTSKSNKISELETQLKQKLEEIASLERKVKELTLKPNEYSSGMAAALAKADLISEEEHQKLEDNISLGRDVTSYWEDFETYVDSYAPSPILVTEFGRFSVVNCTPHDVVINGPSGICTISPSEVCTRLEMDQKDAELPDSDLPLVVEAKGKLINVPVRKDKTLYIVSRIVFDVSTDREDFICPNVIRAKRSGKNVESVPNFICRKALIQKYSAEN